MNRVMIDFETYSATPIKAGVYRYTEDPVFRPLLMGFKTPRMARAEVVDDPSEMRELLDRWCSDRGTILVAHNAAFDRVVASRIVGLPADEFLDPDRWDCTMIRCAEYGLPKSLKLAAKALGVDDKDEAGHDLIRRFCFPGPRAWDRAERPDEWAAFAEYCRQDVEVLAQLDERLPGWPAEGERRGWVVSERINDVGLALDMPMVIGAVDADRENRDRDGTRFEELTGGVNPRSGQQVIEWLAGHGVTVEDTTKATIDGVLADAATPDVVREALTLRRGLVLASAAKYHAAVDTVCADGRARGVFAFGGAGNTMRFSGRGIQPQNYSRDALPEAEIEAVALDLSLGLGADPATLKRAVRGMILLNGVSVDYSAIEARVIAWLAGEEPLLETFRRGGDVYVDTAERMSTGTRSYTRQEGKVATLACIAEGEPVLTDRGLVPIEQVTSSDLVWDGVEWVAQDGPVFMGVKEVMTYDGLTATPDHQVWCEGVGGTVAFGDAAARNLRLAQTGSGRNAVWLGGGDFPRPPVHQAEAPSTVRGGSVCRVRYREVVTPDQPETRQVAGSSVVFDTAGDRVDPALQGPDFREGALHEPQGTELPKLRGAGDSLRLRIHNLRLLVGFGEPAMGNSAPAVRQSQEHRASRLAPRGLALQPRARDEATVSRNDARGNPGRREDRHPRKTEELASNAGLVRRARVYDLLNCGPRHRFTVSGVLVHNCSYSGGVQALRNMGLDESVPDAEAKAIVDAYRAANPAIVKLWRQLGTALRTPGDHHIGKHLTAVRRDDLLIVRLPSGRSIYYRGLRETEGRFGPEFVRKLPTGAVERVHSGVLANNVTQATARDLLVHALIGLHDRGYRVVGHVHDEILVEGTDRVDEVSAIMAELPVWAAGLPVKAEGYAGRRYSK